MSSLRRSSRGMAMLFVLGALALSITATMLIARARTADRLNLLLDTRHAISQDLLVTSGDAIRNWLDTSAPSIVLPPEVEQPFVSILDDWWGDDSVSWRLKITAWDQCGLVPLDAIKAGHPLGEALPRSVLDAINRALLDRVTQYGLDQFCGEQESPFPRSAQQEPIWFGSGGVIAGTQVETGRLDPEPALGGYVATHAPGLSGSAPSQVPIWINVNTTPMPLLRQAFALAQVDGLGLVERARTEGEKATVNFRAAARGHGDQAPIRFVTSSPVWAFRIDAEVMGFRRSWWEIWTNERGNWEAVQRLAIPR